MLSVDVFAGVTPIVSHIVGASAVTSAMSISGFSDIIKGNGHWGLKCQHIFI